jgi:hypothetical protein
VSTNMRTKGLRKRLDLTGQKFHRLTVISFAGLDGRRNSQWLCRCDCGIKKVFRGSYLARGRQKSCGCIVCERKPGSISHLPELHIYCGMLDRCRNPNYPGFADYGGRGLKVCARWRESFRNFLEDMGHRPSPGHTVERINNDGNYCPENCRWATAKEQANNRRDNVRLTFRGETKTLKEWAEQLGLNYARLKSRHRRGWSASRLLSEPPVIPPLSAEIVRTIRSRLASGESVRALARECHIPPSTVSEIGSGKRYASVR